jgi:ABC-2 type transport system permease protein
MRALLGRLGAALYRLARLMRKEFWQYRADTLFTALLIGLPLLQMTLVVNVAGGRGGSGYPLAVIDQDQSPASRAVIAAVENTGEVRVALRLTRLADGDQALSSGQANALLVLPPSFEADLASGVRPADVLVVADGANTWAATTILNAVNGAISGYLEGALLPGSVRPGVELRATKYFAIERIQDPVSSQMGFLLYQVVLIAAGLSIAREQETGTLEQLLVTPLSRLELIVGKTLPALVLGMADFWLLFAVARLVWDMPVRGSLGLLFALAVLFILAESAWGLFLSSRVAKQQQAVQLVFIQILFDLSFCGYVVPVHNLPWFLRWISELLPLRHYLECLRSILLRGGDASTVAVHIAALVCINVVLWTLSVTSLRQRLR